VFASRGTGQVFRPPAGRPDKSSAAVLSRERREAAWSDPLDDPWRVARDFPRAPQARLCRMHASDTIQPGGDYRRTPCARHADFLFAGRGPGCPDPRSMRLRTSARPLLHVAVLSRAAVAF
jgi:hypothetical protein